MTLSSPLLLTSLLLLYGCSTVDIVGSRGELGADAANADLGLGGETGSSLETEGDGILGTGGNEPAEIPNILEERVDAPLAVVNEKVNAAFEQLFFGDPWTEAVFRDLGDGSAFIEDIYHQDVRTDSMGYGMLVAVQLGKEEVFDQLWTWAKRHMLNTEGPAAGLLNWNCSKDGSVCTPASSTDAMSVIVTALFLADSRFPDGAHDYLLDADSLLDAMTRIEQRNGGIVAGVVNSFDLEVGLPRPGSISFAAVVPVDYVMPAFYEYWAVKRPEEAELWTWIADNSRTLLSHILEPATGLYPGTVDYTGAPVPGAWNYTATTSRAHFNLALDHLRYGPHEWVVARNEVLLDFFLAQGVDTYAAEYAITGEPLVTFNTPAHRSMVALAAGTTLRNRHDPFLNELLDQATPSGTFRYYDGMLYLLSLLVLSGQFSLN